MRRPTQPFWARCGWLTLQPSEDRQERQLAADDALFEDEEAKDITKDQWLRAQRDLVTTTLDYNLQTISSLVSDGRIDLSPTFQRRERWDDTRRSRLIESFLMNVPMPPVFLNEDEYGQYSVIDGKQRLTTVSEFMANRFALSNLTIFEEANGSRFRDLDPSLRSVLETRASLRAIIILRMSDPLIKYHVFQRLNTGGVKLNAQEVRNVVFDGPLNHLLGEIASLREVQMTLGIDPKRPQDSATWRAMRDKELVLRFWTIDEVRTEYSGSLGGAMNTFMELHQQADRRELQSLRESFLTTIAAAKAAFGEQVFRRYNLRTQKWARPILAPLFDAQMLACRDLEPVALEAASPQIVRKMKELFEDPEFTRAIGLATNTPAFLRYRIDRVSELVRDCLR